MWTIRFVTNLYNIQDNRSLIAYVSTNKVLKALGIYIYTEREVIESCEFCDPIMQHLIRVYKVLRHIMQPQTGTPGRTISLFDKCTIQVLLNSLRNTWDQLFYVPSVGRINGYECFAQGTSVTAVGKVNIQIQLCIKACFVGVLALLYYKRCNT